MRVTSAGMHSSLSRALAQAAERASRAQDELGTGKRIVRASDGPADASRLIVLDADVAANSAHQRSLEDARSWSNTLDQALVNSSQVLSSAQGSAVAAVNASLTPQTRGAYADEIVQLRDQLATVANAAYGGHAVLAGHSAKAVTAAATYGGWSFSGQAGQVLRRIDSNTTVDVAWDGKELLGFNRADGKDAFTALTDLSIAVRNGDKAGIDAATAVLDELGTAFLGAAETVGVRSNTLDRVAERLVTTGIETERNRSLIGEVDMARAYLDVQSAQTAYSAALAAVSRATLPSLVDFL